VAARSKASTVRFLECRDHGFEFCVCVVLCIESGFATANNSSEASCRLCRKDYETEEETRAKQRAVQPLTNE
jgi:hypothetical protein